jgi:hypothetical protein
MLSYISCTGWYKKLWIEDADSFADFHYIYMLYPDIIDPARLATLAGGAVAESNLLSCCVQD